MLGLDVLLEEDRSESRVESTDTLILQDLGETTEKTAGELGVRDETDTGSLERAESDISKEFGGGRGGKVDGSAVVGGRLKTELVDPLLLEEFVTSELEGTLEEVTSGGRTETGQEGAGTLSSNDLADTTEETAVVGDGVKLDTSLDTVRR